MPNGNEEFKNSPLDDLSDEEVAKLLNQTARLKGKSGGFRPVRPQRQREVDLSQYLGGLEDPK